MCALALSPKFSEMKLAAPFNRLLTICFGMTNSPVKTPATAAKWHINWRNIMLELTAKLNELNEDGQLLVRLLQNDDFPTIQGVTVRINKFSQIFLRSTLTRRERHELFDPNGKRRTAALSDAEETHVSNVERVYGAEDNGLYSFNPVQELYNQTGRCAHCLGMRHVEHGWRLNPNNDHAEQINRLGKYFQWWIWEGHFEPIAPREPDLQTQQVLNALFGKQRVSRAAQALGSLTSEKKKKSSAENGKSGGRPKIDNPSPAALYQRNRRRK